jgi:hypothetical protein
MCKLLQGAGNEAEENSKEAEEVPQARGNKAAFEGAMDGAARVGI